jgi:glycosyltransferase involved in cell wall biosynthesis
LFDGIDPRVNLLPEVKELSYLRSSFAEKLRHGCYYAALLLLWDAVKAPFVTVKPDQNWRKILRRVANPLPACYDLALSFFLPFDFLHEKVTAKVKMGWIHTDYSVEASDMAFLAEQYGKVDVIAAVSEACRTTFVRQLPQFADRVTVIENILPEALIRRQAEAFDVTDEMPKKGIRLLSVGRYCTAKNFDNLPAICANLVKDGLDVYWYVIGFGPDERLIRQRIAEAGMEERVILLGKKENPYPYMAACDLYLQPSRYEGKCVSVREAQLLGKPVVITRYPTAASQLTDGVDGVVVPLDNEGCAAGIAALLRDPERMAALSRACGEREYAGKGEVEKLYDLLG